MAIPIDQLTAMADQPIVVQRHDDRYVPSHGLARDTSRETRQMLNVDNVRLPIVKDLRRELLNRRIGVALLKRFARLKRVVDAEHRDVIIVPHPQGEFAGMRIRVAGEHGDLIAPRRRQGSSKISGVHLGAAVCGRRESVDDLENPHLLVLVACH
jgi:hypothetical protein